jgi:GT2 family glycosyltransferase
MAFELVEYLRTKLAWTCPIVLIDQSDDEGAELARLLRESCFRDVFQQVQHQRGTSAARNLGAGYVTSSWIIFIDDDVRPADDYLDNLHAFLEANPWVDAVQGKVEYDWDEYNGDRIRWDAVHTRVNGTRQAAEKHWGGLEYLLRTPKAKYSCMVLGLGSGNLAISKAAFESAGGFDEQCEGLGEDIELGLRLWWFGYRSCLCPGVVGFHLRASYGGTRNERSRWQTLFNPEPPVSLTYFLLKWFPGRPFWEEISKHAAKWFRRPWVIPIKIIRLWRSMRIAKKRLIAGPRYLRAPVCRADALEQKQSIEKVASCQ